MKKYFASFINHLFKYKYYILVLFFIALIIFYFLNRPHQPSYRNQITPGQTTPEQLSQRLGQPTNKGQWKSFEVLDYPSNSKWNDKIFLQNNEIALVTEIIPRETTQKSTNYINKYGNPPLTMYGLLSPTFNLYAYPSLGFAMVANPDQKILYQLWYFPPTTNNDFINNLATPNEYTLDIPDENH